MCVLAVNYANDTGLKFYHFAFALILIVKTVYCRDYVAVFVFPVVVG